MWWMFLNIFIYFVFFCSFSSSFVSFVVLDLNRRPSVQVPEHGWGRRRRWVSLPGGIRTCDLLVCSDLWTNWSGCVPSLTPAISWHMTIRWPMTIHRPCSLPTDSLLTNFIRHCHHSCNSRCPRVRLPSARSARTLEEGGSQKKHSNDNLKKVNKSVGSANCRVGKKRRGRWIVGSAKNVVVGELSHLLDR